MARTGGYGELAEAFGEKGKYFEELYDKPLEFISTERQMGEQKLSTETGKSLFDIKQQGDVAAARGGFARSGATASTIKRAQGGVFQDYTMQQKSLEEARSGALTRADIRGQGIESDWAGTQAAYGEEGTALGRSQLGYETGVSDIAQTGEEEFWKNLMSVNQFS